MPNDRKTCELHPHFDGSSRRPLSPRVGACRGSSGPSRAPAGCDGRSSFGSHRARPSLLQRPGPAGRCFQTQALLNPRTSRKLGSQIPDCELWLRVGWELSEMEPTAWVQARGWLSKEHPDGPLGSRRQSHLMSQC